MKRATKTPGSEVVMTSSGVERSRKNVYGDLFMYVLLPFNVQFIIKFPRKYIKTGFELLESLKIFFVSFLHYDKGIANKYYSHV